MNVRPLLFLAALGVAGCSTPPYVAARDPGAHSFHPSAVEHGHDTFEGKGGVRIYEQWWEPHGTPRAVLVVVHGLKDHGARYAELAERLAMRGFAVYAADLRGHGRSEGTRVYVGAFDDYVDDLDTLVKRVKMREPDRKVFVLGHSMGGAIVTLYALQKKPDIAGIALSGAALEADVGFPKALGTKVVAAFSPGAGVFQLDLTKFSRDPEVVRECQEDPLVYQSAAPARTAKELLAAIDRIGEHMEDLTVPFFAMHGSKDEITPPQGSIDLHRRARATDKKLMIYPGLVHDLLHEPEKEAVMKDLAEWLLAHAR